MDLPSNTITTRIKFADIVTMFEKISQAKSIQNKADIVKKYFDSFYDFQKKFKTENGVDDCNTSLYPVIRLLLPKADQTSFGIHSPTMAKLYIKLLAIDSKSNEANILNRVTRVKGDYADVVYSVIKNRTSTSPSNMTVYEVSRSLDAIADCYHNNKRANQETELAGLVTDMSALEQKWIIRIILKNLHLNIRPQKILSCMHPKAVELHSKHADLRKLCEILERGDINLDDESTIELFSPIRPMLSGRIDRSSIEQKCLTKDFYLETKMDGERFLLHKSGEKYKYFSRRGFEYTNTFGCDILDGSLTPLLYRLLSSTIDNVILDGEMMVWNKEKLYYHSKGENTDVKALAKNHPTQRPCYVVFDVLYLNGACLIDKPLAERIRILATLIKEQTGVLMLCKRVTVENSNHVFQCLNKAIDDKEEGVVIKEQDSVYKPNSRVSGWYKIKPDYIEGMISEFDLVIIGGYYNKARSYVESFLLGVMDNCTNKGDPIFYSCVHVTKGLSRDQWYKLNTELESHWNDVEYIKEGRKSMVVNPPNIVLGNSGAHVWIEPSLSVVLEVKATELTKTSTFGTEYTLRFPRITKIRDDKSWDDCCTLEEFKQLSSTSSNILDPGDRPSTSNNVRKIAKRFNFNEQTAVSKPKKARAASKPVRAVPRPLPLLKNIEQGNNYFLGLEFCVLSTYRRDYKLNIEHFEEKIVRHGGKIVKNPCRNTFAIIAGDISIRVKQLQTVRKYNILKLEWIDRYINDESNLNRTSLDLHPTDFITTTEEYEFKLQMKFDKLGDSFTRKLKDKSELHNLLTNIEVSNQLHDMHLTKHELLDIEKEIFGKSKPFYIFRLLTAHFYYNNKNSSNDAIKLAEIIYKSRGGTTVNMAEARSAYINYIIVDNDSDSFSLTEINTILSKHSLTELVKLSHKWIYECDKLQKIVNITEYLV